MQSPYIKKMVKELGLSEKEVVKFWNTAIKTTEDMRGMEEDNFTYKEYNYAMQTVRHLALPEEKILEESISISEFIGSGKTAQEFLETVTSGNFSIGDKTAIKQSKNLGKDFELEDEGLDIDVALDKASKVNKEEKPESREIDYKKKVKKRENFEASEDAVSDINKMYENLGD